MTALEKFKKALLEIGGKSSAPPPLLLERRFEGPRHNQALFEFARDVCTFDDKTGCELWPVKEDNPTFWINGKAIDARYALAVAVHGWFPKSAMRQTCGNSRCVNPLHVEILPFDLSVVDPVEVAA